jgi:hypothetical protein
MKKTNKLKLRSLFVVWYIPAGSGGYGLGMPVRYGQITAKNVLEAIKIVQKRYGLTTSYELVKEDSLGNELKSYTIRQGKVYKY